MGQYVKNGLLLFTTCLLCVYAAELLLGLYLVKSLPRYPLPPHAEQEHRTGDYVVRYRYNNVSLRGAEYDPRVTYDAVILGDSFFFGQGVGEGKTLVALLERKGLRIFTASEIATNPLDYFHKFRILQSQGLKAKRVIVGLCMGNDFQNIADKKIADALAYDYRPAFLRYGALEFVTLERLRYQLNKRRVNVQDWLQCRFSGCACRETAVVHDFERKKRFYSDWLQFFTDNRPEMIQAMRGAGMPVGGVSEADYFSMGQFSEASLRNTALILNTLGRWSAPVPVTVVLIPGPHYVLGFRSPRYDRFVESLKSSLHPGMAVRDLHGVMTPAMHFPRDGHWNGQGHAFLADWMVKNVLSPPE